MLSLNQAELDLICGGDGEPQPTTFPPSQSRQDIQNILDQLHRLYGGSAAP